MMHIQNRVLTLVLLLIICISSVFGQKVYVVQKPKNAAGAKIHNDAVSKGLRFKDTDVIEWGNNDNVAIDATELSTGKLFTFSKRQFESKGGRIKTVKDYFLRTSKTSTRETGSDVPITVKTGIDRFYFKEHRIALVIGNSTYTHLPSLQNPQSDAVSVTDKLLTLGFDVVETFDCDYQEFCSVLSQFEMKANDYQLVLFYYAGHGIQKDGRNYLVPVTEQLQKPDDINHCISCDDILRSLERTSCHSRIVIFDACRKFNSALSDGNNKGLAQIQDLAPGTMLIYSTGFGKEASDGEGDSDHSPFAQALLNNIGKPSVDIEKEMKNVMNETLRLTSKRQCPAITSTLTETIVLNPREATQTSSTGSGGTPTGTTTNVPDPKAQTLVDQGKRACKSFNYSLAYKCFTEAANMNDMEGCYQLGMLYNNDNFDNHNIDDAVAWLTKAANMGHTDAMFQLGIIYQGRDNASAKQWLRKAAAKGHAKAADRLSRMR